MNDIAKQSNPAYSLSKSDSLVDLTALKEIVFSHKSLFSESARYIVRVYNDFFNNGKDESLSCYPCVRRGVEFMRKLLVNNDEIYFEGNVPPVYTIYDHPLDFPNAYVVRCHISVKGQAMPMPGVFFVSADLKKCEMKMMELNVIPVGRHLSDDPKIIRSYI